MSKKEKRWVVFDIGHHIFNDFETRIYAEQEDISNSNDAIKFHYIEALNIKEAREIFFQRTLYKENKEMLKADWKWDILRWVGYLYCGEGKELEELQAEYGEDEGKKVFNIGYFSEDYLLSETRNIDPLKMSEGSKEIYEILDTTTILKLIAEIKETNVIAYPLIMK